MPIVIWCWPVSFFRLKSAGHLTSPSETKVVGLPAGESRSEEAIQSVSVAIHSDCSQGYF
jgi:hypothetical protein